MAPAEAVNAASCATVLEYRVNAAVLSVSEAGLSVIVDGDDMVYVPVAEAGALMLLATKLVVVSVPATFSESLICMADDSEEEILFVTNVLAVSVPDMLTPSFTCMAVLSLLLISLVTNAADVTVPDTLMESLICIFSLQYIFKLFIAFCHKKQL